MALEGSITHWISQLKAGDQAAAQPLWERYFQKLVNLARKRLQNLPRRAADEQDVALSAFASFCRGVEKGRFPLLEDRDSLWKMLVVITARKVIDWRQHENRSKRGGGAVEAEAVAVEEVIGREPTPEFAAQVTEEYQRLLYLLPEPELRAIAQAKMEEFTNAEIAHQLGFAIRTVERKLRRIRGLWAQEMTS
jgi:RNA polymerase sigma factor (sigma-70 family)